MFINVTFETTQYGGLCQIPSPPSYVDYDPTYQTVAHQFVDTASKFANHIAIETADVCWTYAELTDRINSIGNAILAELPEPLSPSSSEEGPDEDFADPIVIFLEQGPPAIAAMMAVFQTGKTVVLVDPADSVNRITKILSEIAPRLLITDSQHRSTATDLLSCDCKLVDVEMIASCPTGMTLPVYATANGLAYIAYTSGSTGRPKGVMHRHSSLSVDMKKKHAFHRMCSEDRCSLLVSANGQAIKNTLLALLTGAAILPVDPRAAFHQPFEWLRKNRITVFAVTAPLFRVIANEAAEAKPISTVRLVRLTSDCLYPEDIRNFKRIFRGNCVLLNLLSSTETGSICGYVFDQNTEIPDTPPPCGFPFERQHVTLINNPHPISSNTGGDLSARGHIAVGDSHLFCGYWKQPDLSKQAFITLPGNDSKRFFRTNDLASLRKDGALVFEGRSDFQTKINGRLVNMTEVESAILRHPKCLNATIQTWVDSSGDRRLLAYYVDGGRTVTPEELREHLVGILPQYMIPSHFIPLSTLPTLSNGSIDRQALPTVDEVRPNASTATIEPVSLSSRTLSAIWCNTLRLDTISIHDNFFHLGGTSLQGMKVLAEIDRLFSQSISLQDLINHPTIADLSKWLASTETSNSNDRSVELVRVNQSQTSHRPTLVIAPGLFGHVREWQKLFSATSFQRPVVGIQLKEKGKYERSNATIETIAARLVAEVEEQLGKQPLHLIGHSFGGTLAYEMGQQLSLRGLKPLSVTVVDCKPRMALQAISARDTLSMATNAPFWFVNEIRVYGLTELAKRFARYATFNRPKTTATKKEKSKDGLEETAEATARRMFDFSEFAPAHRQWLVQRYVAHRKYKTQPTENHVVYLRSRIKPLLHRHTPDGMWNQFTDDQQLSVYSIPGDHGQPLHELWHQRFATTLQQALLQVENSSQHQ